MESTSEDMQVKEAIQECLARMLAHGVGREGSIPAAAATASGNGDKIPDTIRVGNTLVNKTGSTEGSSDFARESGELSSENGEHPDLVDSDDEDNDLHFIYDDDGDVTNIAPRMPCAATVRAEHREKLNPQGLYNACVARPVKPAELKVNEKARAAM